MDRENLEFIVASEEYEEHVMHFRKGFLERLIPVGMGVAGLSYFSKMMADMDIEMIGPAGVVIGYGACAVYTGFAAYELIKYCIPRFFTPDPDDPSREELPQELDNVVDLDARRNSLSEKKVVNY